VTTIALLDLDRCTCGHGRSQHQPLGYPCVGTDLCTCVSFTSDGWCIDEVGNLVPPRPDDDAVWCVTCVRWHQPRERPIECSMPTCRTLTADVHGRCEDHR
jgi:hypothetical protein